MSNTKQLPTREQVPTALTWDLTVLYPSDEAWEESYQAVSQRIPQLLASQGTLCDGVEQLESSLKLLLDLNRNVENIYVYSHLKNDQDTSNSTYQEMLDRSILLATKLGEISAWFTPEVIQIPEETLEQYIASSEFLKGCEHFIHVVVDNRDHVLSADKEELLAGASDILTSASQTFSVLNNADIQFPEVTNDAGEKVQLSHGLYGQLLESTNRQVRIEAFEALYKVYQGLVNTFASTLQANVKNHNFQARVRGYRSARHAALAANHIPEEVHDTLVATVNKNLTLLHRYMKLRKEMLNLETLHMYDLYTPLMGEGQLEMTYEDSKQVVFDALAILGPEYRDILEQAFTQRWIDVVENKGKRSGAYSSGSYDSYPYVLLNWHDTLDNVFTLVHELGHSAHSYFTRKTQPYVYGDYSIFLAEIASTTNENLLTDYLLKNAKSPLERAHILSHYLDGFKATVFRQTQFAEFEHFMHEQAASGQPLTADFLSKYYYKLNQTYYGPDVVSDDQIAYEWSRIPHFYYNYYVYQYATGFSAATSLAHGILSEKEGARDAYLDYLRAGSSKYPIDVMKLAGVDMTDAKYLEDALAVFEKRLNELEETIAELKN
ncbi:oligoendopeptidase F [Allofustis seminis]|uniref:oligoendopeptidase F n=1 Tax=Allofustis seminis TaxID=166939 RepID=UPI00036C5280|nr:oligoendopeptidase F [Allofustis seminis]